MEEAGTHIYQYAESAMDEAWAEKTDYNGEAVLVIIEGLTMYLSLCDVKKIFCIIDKKFPKATVFVGTMNPFVVKSRNIQSYLCIGKIENNLNGGGM